jgi:hypothetical protein
MQTSGKPGNRSAHCATTDQAGAVQIPEVLCAAPSREPLINPSFRRMPESIALNSLDPGMRRDDEQRINQQFPSSHDCTGAAAKHLGSHGKSPPLSIGEPKPLPLELFLEHTVQSVIPALPMASQSADSGRRRD